MSARRRAYVAFEGGGAKGVAHVGALAALEDVYDCRGFAGTSAGSLAAALAAAGFRARDIIDPDGGGTLLALVPGRREAMDLFDPRSRRALEIALALSRVGQRRRRAHRMRTRAGRRLYRAAAAGAATGGACASLAAALFALGATPPEALGATAALVVLFGVQAALRGRRRFGRGMRRTCLVIGTLAAHLLWAGTVPVLALGGGLLVWRLWPGVASLDRLEADLDQLLRERLAQEGRDPDEPVRFGDFGPMSATEERRARPSLKMVATDLSTGKLALFSPERTPEAKVSAAVAASICIPGVFQPRRMGPAEGLARAGMFFDGGLVSNLPAWSFDDERRIDRHAATFVISVGDEPLARPRGAVAWLGRLARSAIFGAAELNLRVIGRSVHVALDTHAISTLDFDAPFARVRETMLVGGRQVMQRRIEDEMQAERSCELLPELFRGFLRDAYDQAGAAEEPPRCEGMRIEAMRIRASIADVTDLVGVWRDAGLGEAVSGEEALDALLLRTPEIPIQFRWQTGFAGATDEGLPLPPRSVCGRALLRLCAGAPEADLVIFEAGDGRREEYLFAEQDAWARAAAARDLAWIFAMPISVTENFGGALSTERHILCVLDGNAPLAMSDHAAVAALQDAVDKMYKQTQDMIRGSFPHI